MQSSIFGSIAGWIVSPCGPQSPSPTTQRAEQARRIKPRIHLLIDDPSAGLSLPLTEARLYVSLVVPPERQASALRLTPREWECNTIHESMVPRVIGGSAAPTPLRRPQSSNCLAGRLRWHSTSPLLCWGLAGGWVAALFERRGWLAGQTCIAEPVPAPCACSANAESSITAGHVFSLEMPSIAPTPLAASCGCAAGAPAVLATSCGCRQSENTYASEGVGSGGARSLSDHAQRSRQVAAQTPQVTLATFVNEFYRSGRQLLVMFLGFAFIGYFLNGLIPASWVGAVFGGGNIYNVPLAATLGLPLYINSEASLPLIRALLDNGMSQGAPQLAYHPSSPEHFTSIYILVAATVGMVPSLISALGEEIGWRGLLLPELAKITSFTRTALLSGGVWAIWHLPLLLFTDYSTGTSVWFAVGCFAAIVIAFGCVSAWLRLQAASLWPAVVLHASHNLFIKNIFTPLTSNTGLTPYIIDECGIALVIALVLFALWQALIAALYALLGHRAPWDASIGWWPLCSKIARRAPGMPRASSSLHRMGACGS
jgi:membrane protease YdiL (CAAX protease family)